MAISSRRRTKSKERIQELEAKLEEVKQAVDFDIKVTTDIIKTYSEGAEENKHDKLSLSYCINKSAQSMAELELKGLKKLYALF